MQNTESENEVLKKAINDKDIMLENTKSDSLLLRNKLEKAENEMVKHLAESKKAIEFAIVYFINLYVMQDSYGEGVGATLRCHSKGFWAFS